ncbi:MAG: sigma-54-dependent Fis family transcriptional regulator [bacterium]|nr:sigma-54-dependent Fis family transcriptional regulator [bacterium]
MKKILLVDDDVAVTNYFMVFLMQTELFDPTIENDSREVEALLDENSYDVILLDLDMPNVSGMDILKIMHAKKIDSPVIILTGVSDVDLAVKAMKHGAFDYLTKPVDEEHLLDILNSAMEQSALRNTLAELPDDLTRENLINEAAFQHMPTQNESVIRLFHKAETLASGDLSVFIWGERGSGKKWLARAMHNASTRSEMPFISLNCTSFAQNDLSVELFGRDQDWSGKVSKKSGLLKVAEGGTLFINNIEYMNPAVQQRLNNVLQQNEYSHDNSTEKIECNVRFIVASSYDLTRSVFKESFSRDLLYHLMANSLKMLPVRDRPDDIRLIAELFLEEANTLNNKQLTGISDEFVNLLQNYRFPGNMHEMRELISGAVVNADEGELASDSLSPYHRERITLGGFTPKTMQEVMHRQAKDTISFCNNDIVKSAKILDISAEELKKLL